LRDGECGLRPRDAGFVAGLAEAGDWESSPGSATPATGIKLPAAVAQLPAPSSSAFLPAAGRTSRGFAANLRPATRDNLPAATACGISARKARSRGQRPQLQGERRPWGRRECPTVAGLAEAGDWESSRGQRPQLQRERRPWRRREYTIVAGLVEAGDWESPPGSATPATGIKLPAAVAELPASSSFAFPSSRGSAANPPTPSGTPSLLTSHFPLRHCPGSQLPASSSSAFLPAAGRTSRGFAANLRPATRDNLPAATACRISAHKTRSRGQRPQLHVAPTPLLPSPFPLLPSPAVSPVRRQRRKNVIYGL
jgi:hypothetical protein